MNATNSQPEYATDRQIAFGKEHKLRISKRTRFTTAFDKIGAFIADNPLSDEERAARSAARRERLANLPASEKQVAMIQKITKGRYTPKNQLQVQGFFAGLRNRQSATAE